MNIKLKSAVAAAFFTAAASLSAQFQNPALELFPDDVTFYVNFDESPAALLSSGEGSPFRADGIPDYAPGLSGKALRHGMLHYRGAQNADLSSTGTLIYWVAPEKEMTGESADGKEPGFLAVVISTDNYFSSLFSGKTGGQPWKKAPLNSYVQYKASAKIHHVNCTIYHRLSAADWKPGDWKMLAVTWRPGSISATLNGSESVRSKLKVPMKGVADEIRLGFGKEAIPFQMLLDEVVILKRELSDEELLKLYDLSEKQRKR